MKKQWIKGVAAFLCAVLACGVLAGCSSDRPQDGTYTARYRNASGGWMEYLTVTFRDGKVTKAEFDGYRENDPSSKKSQVSKEEYPMDPHPSEWMPILSKNVMTAGGDPNKIATVAGATSSTGHARELYRAILDAAADGKTDEIILDNEKDNSGDMWGGDMSGDMSSGSSEGMSGDSGMGDIIDGDMSGDTGGDMAADSNSGNNGTTEGVLPDSGTNSNAGSGAGNDMNGDSTVSDSQSSSGSSAGSSDSAAR